LIRAHVQAVWLAETGANLKRSLKDILDIGGEPPPLTLLDGILTDIGSEPARRRARERAVRVLESIGAELTRSGWFTDDWLDDVLHQAAHQLHKACDRWRGLYRSALKQQAVQNDVIRRADRSESDKRHAERLRKEAEQQLKLLLDTDDYAQSDFYSYRYFASEGFLPGYNFPRLPLSAFIPARKTKQREEYLSRPRFLAISEFGPRAVVYHEGSRYEINRVIMPVEEDGVLTGRAKQCDACGYLHPLAGGHGPDQCERCGELLSGELTDLLRLQNVATRRRDKINCDEEERLRLGYEIRSGVRFGDAGGIPVQITAEIVSGGNVWMCLTYARAATIWRINLGWRQRTNRTQHGFLLDIERGYWQSSEQEPRAENEVEDPMSANRKRVIPFVEDRRNCILIEPASNLDAVQMVSLEAALKNALQVSYQLEDNELASELLPNYNKPRLLLIYESAEGGAGVLRRLIHEPEAFANVAKAALEICHFDPETGIDNRRSSPSAEECEAACYDCLMHYANQPVHRLLDRKKIRDTLLEAAGGRAQTSPGGDPRADHLSRLRERAGSELERRWLERVAALGLRLPNHGQHYIEACRTTPDFYYDSDFVTAIYVDGPPHDFPERQQRDAAVTASLEDDYGIKVIRFHHQDDWDRLFAENVGVFGRPS
jgi:hypothetical protein